MKKQRSIRPGVENLEPKALLSAGAAPHLPGRPESPPAVAEVARRPVHLFGTVVLGTGTVLPMGGVHGSINVGQKTLTLTNGRGSVKVRLMQAHKYPYTFIAHAWKIMSGTRNFRSFSGQGPTSVVATTVRGRLVSWSASFW